MLQQSTVSGSLGAKHESIAICNLGSWQKAVLQDCAKIPSAIAWETQGTISVTRTLLRFNASALLRTKHELVSSKRRST